MEIDTGDRDVPGPGDVMVRPRTYTSDLGREWGLDTASAALIPTLVAIRQGTYPDRPGNGYGEAWEHETTDLPAVGDSFTIIDYHKFSAFPNGQLTLTLASSPGWTATTQLTGGYPASVSVVDDPAVPNVKWTYTTAAPQPPGTPSEFHAYVEPFNAATQTTWPSNQRRLTPVVSVQGATVTTGTTLVPTAAPVPEPTAACAIAAAAGGLLTRRWRRARA